MLDIIIATIVGFGIGMVWYSPYGFGKHWMKIAGSSDKKKIPKDEMQKLMAFSMTGAVLSSLVKAAVLAAFLQWLNPLSLQLSLWYALLAWLGFMMPITLSPVLFEQKPFQLFLINTGYYLVSILVMAGVIFYL